MPTWLLVVVEFAKAAASAVYTFAMDNHATAALIALVVLAFGNLIGGNPTGAVMVAVVAVLGALASGNFLPQPK